MNCEELDKNTISEATKIDAATDDEMKANEVAIGKCDKLINNELRVLENRIAEITDEVLSENDPVSLSTFGDVDIDLDDILCNVRILTEARRYLAARNAALT